MAKRILQPRQGILQPTQGSPFRPNVGAETIQGIVGLLQQFQAGKQGAQQRQAGLETQELQDLFTAAQTKESQARTSKLINPPPKILSPSEQRAKLKLDLESVIVDPNAPEALKTQAEARLKSISPPAIRLDLNRQSRQDRIKELETFIDILTPQAGDLTSPGQKKAQERLEFFTAELETLIKQGGTASQVTTRRRANERVSAIALTDGDRHRVGDTITVPASQFDAAVKAGAIRAK